MQKIIHSLALVIISVNFLFAQFSTNQVVPITPIPACSGDVVFELMAECTELTGSTSNSLTLNLGPGAHYIPGSVTVISSTSGTTVSEFDISDDNAPVFTVSDLIFNDEFVIEYLVSLDCSVIGQSNSLNVVEASLSGSAGGPITDTSTEYSSSNGSIELTSSAPVGIDGVIGYEFQIINTVENTGGADVDSVFYCVENTTNASLQSLQIGVTTFLPIGSSPLGFTCFNIGSLAQSLTLSVEENWIITSCSTPIQNLYREATFGCFSNIDCETLSNGLTTVLTLNTPVDPIGISLLLLN